MGVGGGSLVFKHKTCCLDEEILDSDHRPGENNSRFDRMVFEQLAIVPQMTNLDFSIVMVRIFI
jgi:hypothetical protein